jgi:cell division protein FtsB
MDKVISILIPLISSVATWFLTNMYYTREKQNDLEAKLTERIEDLTKMLIEINEKYLFTIEEINKIKFENLELKRQIQLLKSKNCTK